MPEMWNGYIVLGKEHQGTQIDVNGNPINIWYVYVDTQRPDLGLVMENPFVPGSFQTRVKISDPEFYDEEE